MVFFALSSLVRASRAGADRDAAAWGRPDRTASGPVHGPIADPPAIQLIRVAVLVLVLIAVPLSTSGHKLVGVSVALALSTASWLVWQFYRGRPEVWIAALAVMGVAGGSLAGLASLTPAVAIGMVVATSAGSRLDATASVAVTAGTIASFLIFGLTLGDASFSALVGWTAAYAGMWAFGVTRRAYVLRALEAETALEQARRAHAAEAQAAALAERARIAREIHDVLAHSLAAVSVNLQAAEGLLAALPSDSLELAKAIECLDRAGALTREGMAETRRAILALREEGDAGAKAADGPGTQPADLLTGRLKTLADDHRATGDAAVDITITGDPRPLPADAALTVYRTVQEALTNARKHAPGQPVTVTVAYAPDDMTIGVSNPLPPGGTDGPLAHAGTGYGLTGLRERAALAGGTLTAGAENGRWRVSLRIPA